MNRPPLAITATLVAALLAATPLVGCATGPDEPADDEPSAARADAADESDAPSFGDDPMGAARRFAHAPPESTDAATRETVASWSDPAILRLYRERDGAYRAVVADADRRGADALLLSLSRGDDGTWRVDDARPTDATHAWPTN